MNFQPSPSLSTPKLLNILDLRSGRPGARGWAFKMDRLVDSDANLDTLPKELLNQILGYLADDTKSTPKLHLVPTPYLTDSTNTPIKIISCVNKSLRNSVVRDLFQHARLKLVPRQLVLLSSYAYDCRCTLDKAIGKHLRSVAEYWPLDFHRMIDCFLASSLAQYVKSITLVIKADDHSLQQYQPQIMCRIKDFWPPNDQFPHVVRTTFVAPCSLLKVLLKGDRQNKIESKTQLQYHLVSFSIPQQTQPHSHVGRSSQLPTGVNSTQWDEILVNEGLLEPRLSNWNYAAIDLRSRTYYKAPKDMASVIRGGQLPDIMKRTRVYTYVAAIRPIPHVWALIDNKILPQARHVRLRLLPDVQDPCNVPLLGISIDSSYERYLKRLYLKVFSHNLSPWHGHERFQGLRMVELLDVSLFLGGNIWYDIIDMAKNRGLLQSWTANVVGYGIGTLVRTKGSDAIEEANEEFGPGNGPNLTRAFQ